MVIFGAIVQCFIVIGRVIFSAIIFSDLCSSFLLWALLWLCLSQDRGRSRNRCKRRSRCGRVDAGASNFRRGVVNGEWEYILLVGNFPKNTLIPLKVVVFCLLFSFVRWVRSNIKLHQNRLCCTGLGHYISKLICKV